MTVQLAWAVQEELETLLDDSGHLRTLAFLYASRGMSAKALAIWRILARNYSSGLWKDPAFENGSDDTNTNIISGKVTAAAEASKILEESSDPELVIQHLGWVCVYGFYFSWLVMCYFFMILETAFYGSQIKALIRRLLVFLDCGCQPGLCSSSFNIR